MLINGSHKSVSLSALLAVSCMSLDKKMATIGIVNIAIPLIIINIELHIPVNPNIEKRDRSIPRNQHGRSKF
jgi:hypothetical protein